VSDKKINPDHYKSHPSGIECIQVTRHFNFNIGNVIKYLWRAGLKGGSPEIEDLKKAKWYLEDEIKQLEPPPSEAIEHVAGVVGVTEIPIRFKDRMQAQTDEFKMLNSLIVAFRALPAIVDDDYPEMRHYYNAALGDFLRACKANGRHEIT
jgi:hypothetical protein